MDGYVSGGSPGTVGNIPEDRGDHEEEKSISGKRNFSVDATPRLNFRRLITVLEK
jgi:hypothetical protein